MAKPKGVPDPEDIQDVVREEESRGRRPGKRPIDTDILRGRRRRLQDLRKLLRRNRKEDFVEAMRDLGLEPGSAAFEDALQIWKDYRRF